MLGSRFCALVSVALVSPVFASPAPPELPHQRKWVNQLDEILEESLEASPNASALIPRAPATVEMPQPFDHILSTNWTSSTCPAFFTNFLADADFQQCPNLWLLLATSTAFFEAERSPNVTLPAVLDVACGDTPGEDVCQARMSQLARQIQSSSACGKDLAARVPLVVQALQGFQSYGMMRAAGCSKSAATGRYCLQDAVSASSPSSSLFLYYLPLGMPFPNSTKLDKTQPSCDDCNADLMVAFSRYASNETLPIAETYPEARSMMNSVCGGNFSPAVATQASKHSGSPRFAPSVSWAIGTFALVAWLGP